MERAEGMRRGLLGGVPKGRVWLAAALSLLVLAAGYGLGNVAVPLPDEMEVLQDWDRVKALCGETADSVPDEVLLVDVAYDKQLVDFCQEGLPVGQVAITDRRKLLDFLTQAHEAGNYRYILLDVFFEQDYESDADSALFSLIGRMERLVIPCHSDAPLGDSSLLAKAALADYTATWKETGFVRYQYLRDGRETLPLRMYRELEGGDIVRHGWLYWSGGWLCQNGVTLQMPIRLKQGYEEVDGMRCCKVLHLGVDLLDSLVDMRRDIEGRIVVVGDFQNDVHDTYIGSQPGSLICLNAYYALVRGDHILRGRAYGVAIFWVLMGVLYFLMALACLSRFTLSSLTDNPWLQLLLPLLTTNCIFWLVAVVAYVSPLSVVYHVWFPVAFFTLLEFFSNIYFTYKSNKQK